MHKHGARFTKVSGLSAVLGLWLLICSLIFSPSDKLALNGALAGVAITLISAARFSARTTSVGAWTITLLGSWIALTPWLLDEATTELRTWHCVIVGALLAVTETVGVVQVAPTQVSALRGEAGGYAVCRPKSVPPKAQMYLARLCRECAGTVISKPSCIQKSNSSYSLQLVDSGIDWSAPGLNGSTIYVNTLRRRPSALECSGRSGNAIAAPGS